MHKRPDTKIVPRGEPTILHDFISTHRQELIERTQAKLSLRAVPPASTHELANGVPLFLTQLSNILAQEAVQSPPDGLAMGTSATHRGKELLEHGFSIAQVVQDYGDICQAITELALDRGIHLRTQDFHTLNRCLDSAIASAVTEYARQRDADMSAAAARRDGVFAHELRNHLGTAMLAFQIVKSGRVGVTGSTIDVLERSLRGLHDVLDRSISEVRLASGIHHRERLPVSMFIEELEAVASIDAMNRGLHFHVEHTDASAFIDVDRHLFASAISNLLQNAFKFTRPASHVRLRTRSTPDRVSIEVEDECGGFPSGSQAIFQPFQQRSADRGGLGLGLSISRMAVEANGGTLSLRDKPGQGCVFVVDVPRDLTVPGTHRESSELTQVP